MSGANRRNQDQPAHPSYASSSSEETSHAYLPRNASAPEVVAVVQPDALPPHYTHPPRIFSSDDTNALAPGFIGIDPLLPTFLPSNDTGIDDLGELFRRHPGGELESRYSFERRASQDTQPAQEAQATLSNHSSASAAHCSFEKEQETNSNRPKTPTNLARTASVNDDAFYSAATTASDHITGSSAAVPSVWRPAPHMDAATAPRRPSASPTLSNKTSFALNSTIYTEDRANTRPNPPTASVVPNSTFVGSQWPGHGRHGLFRISGPTAPSRRRHLPPRPRSVGDLPSDRVVVPQPRYGVTIDEALPHLSTLIMRHGAELRLGNQAGSDLRVVISEKGTELGAGKELTDLNESLQSLNKISKEILDYKQGHTNKKWIQDIDMYKLSENELVFDFEQQFPRITQWVMAPRFKQWIEINSSSSAFVVAVKGAKRTRFYESQASETRPKSLQIALWELENSLPLSKKPRIQNLRCAQSEAQ